MAYGNVVSYEPGPQPGAFAFQKADGSKFLAFGEPAEDLRSRVDASQQQLAAVQGNADITPQAVAGNDPPSAALPADYERESADRVASALDATPIPAAVNASSSVIPAGPAPLASEPNMSVAPSEAHAAEPAAAEPAHQAAPHGEGVPLFRDPKSKEVVYLVPGGDPKNPADLYTRTPATPAVRAGYSPSSMKVEGANTAATPQDLQHLRENEADQREAYKLSYDLHAQNMAEQRAAIDAQQAGLAVAQREQLERQQQMQAKTDELQQQYDAAKKDFSDSRVDPNRYQRGAIGIGNALAMGLGAYGAAMTKSPNFAANFVQQQTQNDIARQEAEIRIKGQTAQTALGDLNRQLGSMELAKTAYQGIQLQAAKNHLDLLANSTGTRDAAANYLQGSAQLDAALQANDLAFRQQAMGHVTTDFRYHQASGGSPGARNPVTMEQARTAFDVTPKGRPAAKAEEKAAVVQDAVTAADEAAAAAGLTWDPKKGEYIEGPAGSNALIGSAGLATEARQQAHGIISANAGKFAHALGERPPSVDMVDRYAGEFFTNGPQGVLHYKSRLSALRRNLDRSAKHASSLPDTAQERAEERGDE